MIHWHPFNHEDGSGSLKSDVVAECAGLSCYEPSDLERRDLEPIPLTPDIGPYFAEAHVQRGRHRR